MMKSGALALADERLLKQCGERWRKGGADMIEAAREGGEVFLRLEKSKGGGDSTGLTVSPVTAYQAGCAAAGISKATGTRWQKAAKVSAVVVTRYLKGTDSPGLIDLLKITGKVDPPAKKAAPGAELPEPSPARIEAAHKRIVEGYPELARLLRTGKISLVEAVHRADQIDAIEKVEAERKKAIKKTVEDEPRAVATYLAALKEVNRLREESIETATQGKFSPEAQRFVRRLHDEIRRQFTSIEEKFNG